MAKAVKFAVETVVNPETNEEKQRVAVHFSNNEVVKLIQPQEHENFDEWCAYISENKAKLLSQVRMSFHEEYGKACYFSKAQHEKFL